MTESTKVPSTERDVVVVGAGIVGLAVARELLRRDPDRTVTVLEREPTVGFHQTGHNSGVIHAGIYYPPGSLKAQLSRAGSEELYAYCEAKGIPAKRNGKLIVALNDAELPKLDELERRGRANGVPGLRRLPGHEIPEIEPHAHGVAALHSPNTGVVNFQRVAEAYMEDVRAAGGEVVTSCGVLGVTPQSRRIVLRHALGQTAARFAVFCAGGWSDRLAVAAGGDPDPRIVPFRGAWFKIRPERRDLVRGHVYPVPDPNLPFLGVHFTRGIDDEVLIGPTALMVGARDAYALSRLVLADLRSTLAWAGTYRMVRRWWRTGIKELRHALDRRTYVAEAARYIPELGPADVVAGPAGVRAQALGRDGKLIDDFVFTATPRALHVRNAPSPAATSSLAIGRLIADRVEAGIGETPAVPGFVGAA